MAGAFALWLLRSGARRRAREWLGVAAAAAVATVLALATGGAGALVDMIAGPMAGRDQPLLAANSVWGISRVLFSETRMAEPLAVEPMLQVALTVVLALWLTALAAVIMVRPGASAVALFNVAFVVILLLPISHYFYVTYALPVLWWWAQQALERPRSMARWIIFGALLVWWVVVFRIPPEGDGFMTTTWPSLLRIFATCRAAVTVSVIGAAVCRAGGDRRDQPSLEAADPPTSPGPASDSA